MSEKFLASQIDSRASVRWIKGDAEVAREDGARKPINKAARTKLLVLELEGLSCLCATNASCPHCFASSAAASAVSGWSIV